MFTILYMLVYSDLSIKVFKLLPAVLLRFIFYVYWFVTCIVVAIFDINEVIRYTPLI